jgi:actin-like ATPase involved in cell morphogenesis
MDRPIELTDRRSPASLSGVHPRLAIDYGAVSTRAVLAWPDGRWLTVGFGGATSLSSAVHVTKTQIVTGAQAWRQAIADPDGFVVAPLRAGTADICAGGRQVGVAELAAATLREVAGEAARIAGGPVEDVSLVVPAGWGPRRRTWLRHAARAAGLPAVQLVESPVAAASQLRVDSANPSVVLVIDVGGGCEASVLRPGPSGFEVLATLHDPDAGGDRIDLQLTSTLTGTSLHDLPAEQRWKTLADVRAAKQALTEQVAVTMAMPGGKPPLIVNTSHVTQAAGPVFDRVAQLAADAVGGADLTLDQVDTVALVGGAAATPGAAELVTAALGVTVTRAALPEIAAVHAASGAAAGGPPAQSDGAPGSGRPSWRRLVTFAVPGLCSLALFAHFAFGADFEGDRINRVPGRFYVWASWGELAMAGVLAVVFCLRAQSVFASAVADPATAPQRADSGSRVVAGLGLAAVAGLATAGMYAVVAAVYFSYPATEPLRWALLPSLPVGVAALVLAGLAWRGHHPARGWDDLLAFPLSSTITATAGAAGVALYNVAELEDSRIELADYLGVVLLGVAVACALTWHLVARIALALPLAFFLLILSRAGLGIPATIYAIAVALWYVQRVWALARPRPATVPGRPAEGCHGSCVGSIDSAPR